MMIEEDIKKIFSQNLLALRKANNLTQVALAEKLNYSDKAISKWEVGAVLPDVLTLVNIANFFGITLNDLVYPKKKKTSKRFFQNHVFITLSSVALVWFLASIVFLVFDATKLFQQNWIIFIVAIPISFIVLIVFTSLWFKRLWLLLSISGLFWGLLLSIYLIIGNYGLWFIFIVGVVGQFLIAFLGMLKNARKIHK